MVVNVILFISLVLGLSDFNSATISDDEYKLLPPIYHIDNYTKCLSEKKIFCRVSLKLIPLNLTHPSKAWKLIEKTKRSKWHYNHDELSYAICLEDFYNNLSRNHSPETAISEFYSTKYANIGVKAAVQNMDCEDFVYQAGFFDIAYITSLILYFSLIIFATVYDVRNSHRNKKHKKFFILFSIRHNIVRLKNKYNEADFEKLRCIQGLRFYTMVLIILCHTYSSFIGGYISNTEYFEKFCDSHIKCVLMNFFVFLVQTFFLISAWLLSYQSFNVFARSDNLNSFKFILLTFWNRYLRQISALKLLYDSYGLFSSADASKINSIYLLILPPLLVMVCLSRSFWLNDTFDGPLRKVFSDAEYQKCRRNWWINLLFLNNIYRKEEMCYFLSWYLAADTQLYFLCLILLTVIYRFRKHTRSIISFCILTGVVIPSVVTYIYDLEYIFRVTPKNTNANMFLSFAFFATYTSPYTNMATYMVGLMLGYIYYKNENKPLLINHFFGRLWWILFFGLPVLVLILAKYEYGKLTSAILSGVLRPIYALGIGIGILVMSRQKQGIIKKLFECKPIFFLGNVTYCTYVSHIGVVFARTIQASQPMYVSDYIMITSFVRDVIYSFVLGFFMHLLFEMPALQLQSMYVPKFRRQTEKYITKKMS